MIDGLLHHETDLEIHEHYTDTAGYTDPVFGLCHLLGFQFAPRIRDISDAKLYTSSKANDYPPIAELLHRVNIKTFKKILMMFYGYLIRLERAMFPHS